MREAAFFGFAVCRWSYRALEKPVSTALDLFRSVDSEQEEVAAGVNFYALVLKEAYLYYEGRNSECIRKWYEHGYEIIPAAEFEDGYVRDLLESNRRVLIPLRRRTGVHPDENRYEVLVLLRGTAADPEDIKEDFDIVRKDLYRAERVQRSDALVRELVEKYGYKNVCLVGHSLGAAVAFLIARKFYLEQQQTLEGHFFNLPFMDFGTLIQEILSLISPEYVFLCKALSLLSWVPYLNLGEAQELLSQLPCRRATAQQAADEFFRLKGWKPNIYVNEYDRVSRSYIPYFRGMRAEDGPMRIGARAHHLCPSAKLIISKKGISTFNSHSLSTWENRKPHHLRIESYVRN